MEWEQRVVQDRIDAMVGVPLVHPFFTSHVFPPGRSIGITPAEDFVISLSLVTAGGRLYDFTFGNGICEGSSPTRVGVIVFAVHEPGNIGIGTHTYTVTASTPTGVVFEDSGEIVVVENPGGGDPTTEPKMWFDAFDPSPHAPPSDGGGQLPIPEVTTEVQEQRMAVCIMCPELSAKTSECRQCGCYMPLKTGLLGAACPIGKW